MKVRVKDTAQPFGFDGVKRRYPGAVFEFEGATLPSWAELVEPEAKPKQKPGPKPKKAAEVEPADLEGDPDSEETP